MRILKSPEDWRKLVSEIVGASDPESVTFDGSPKEYPCLAKWKTTPDVYRVTACTFFYPEEALELLRQSGHLIPDEDLTDEQKEEIMKALNTGVPPGFLKRE